MKRLLLCSFLIFLLSSCKQAYNVSATPTSTDFPSAGPTETSIPPTSITEPTATLSHPVVLKRGINMGNMLEAPNEGDWGLYVREEYFDLIKDAGFDFVRLPVRWFAHTTYVGYDDGGTAYKIDPEFFARVDEVIGWALEHDLAIIIDFHHYEEIMAEPHLERFLYIWEQIAEHYKDYPPQVMFELLNEPNGNLTAPLWNVYAHYALKVVRESNPTRDVIIGAVNWNSYFWVSTLDVPNDPHIIVTFHYSDPFHLIYQSTDGQAWFGDTWPNNEERKREITRDFDLVADWAQRHNVRILLGEFGVYNEAEMDSIVRWTEFVRSEAESHGFAWAYWDFALGFGAYDPDAKVWREDLLRALIP